MRRSRVSIKGYKEMDVGSSALVPPIIALFFFMFKRITLGLFFGALSSAFLLHHFSFSKSLEYFAVDLVLPNIFNGNHIAIILLTAIIASLSGVLKKSGALSAVIASLSHLVQGRRSLQIVTALSGLLIFFDDHANCKAVGSSMRQSFRVFNVSKEKLAFIVDATASPVTCLALVSTWIGFQVSIIEQSLHYSSHAIDAYALFIESIPYNFYALFTLGLVVIIALLGRDFGPMLSAERNYASKVSTFTPAPVDYKKLAIFLVPVFSMLLTTLLVLSVSTKTNTYMAMLIGASFALFIALLLIFMLEDIEPDDALSWVKKGIKDIAPCIVILVSAWIFAHSLFAIGTVPSLLMFTKHIAPSSWPTLIFALSALLSFITGTSFGTMALLMPIALPTIFLMTSDHTLICATIAAVFGGAVFGDHCSPLSDTTMLASASTHCDLNAHTITQMPYALLAALLAVCCGTLPLAFGVGAVHCFLAGITISLIFVRILGQKTQELTSCPA